MKGGRVRIHLQRWAPADYHDDEHVRLLKARRDYRTLTFYRHFLDHSFTAGGDLPADLEALAAVVEMPRRDVEHALAFCVGRLIEKREGRLYQKRVAREVAHELSYRAEQSELGRRGGQAAGRGRPKHQIGEPLIEDRATPTESIGPPCAVRRAPTPAPTPGTDGGCGNVENPTDPTTPAEDRQNGSPPPDLASLVLRLAVGLEEACPDVRALEWIRRGSVIPAGNGYPEQSFTDPTRPGLSAAWLKTTIERLEQLLRQVDAPLPP